MKNKILLFVLLSCFLFGCAPISSDSDSRTPSPMPPHHKLLLPNSTFSKVVWEQQFYPSGNYFGNVQCAAGNGALVVIGSLDGVENSMAYAFDGKSGKTLWTYKDAFLLVMTEYGLFIGGNENDILLLDPKDGRIIWQIKLNNIRSIRKIMYEEGLLFVYTDGFYQYFVIDSSGKIISKYLQESTFNNDHANTHFAPHLPFGSNNATSDVYIRQFGDITYSVAAYKSSTDELLWKSKTDSSISNFLLYSQYILWVSPDDKLIKANKINGQILDEAEISPSFIFFDNNPDKQHAGYYLCGDDQNKLIYLLLGDSRQLFSISVLE
jgi:outer membrane protein assembly factor BamB